MIGSNTCEGYVVAKTMIYEGELDEAHKILDIKKVPRYIDELGKLTLAMRILVMAGEEIRPRKQQTRDGFEEDIVPMEDDELNPGPHG